VAEFERELTLERTHAGLARGEGLGAARRGGRKPAVGLAKIKRAKVMLADPGWAEPPLRGR
jgi:DNA invertase Pin-like site-specific DNA recombinase